MDNKGMIEELRVALAELESDEGLSRFVEGHGLQSRFFAVSWKSEGLEIEFRLPYARVLSDETEQEMDAARIGAAIRMAVLLLTVSAEGKLLADGEARLSVEAAEDGMRYSIISPDDETMDSGDDWEPLTARLETALPEVADVQIIWP